MLSDEGSNLPGSGTQVWNLGKEKSEHKKVTQSQSGKCLSNPRREKGHNQTSGGVLKGQKSHSCHIKKTDEKIRPNVRKAGMENPSSRTQTFRILCRILKAVDH